MWLWHVRAEPPVESVCPDVSTKYACLNLHPQQGGATAEQLRSATDNTPTPPPTLCGWSNDAQATHATCRQASPDPVVGGIWTHAQSLPWFGFGLFAQPPCVGGATTD